MSVENTAETTAESFEFQAEVSQILNLVVNSLYSNKEIFLRELISNASDAIDKRKFAALTDKSLLGEAEPAIRLSADNDARTLTIEDDGIGMSKDELVKNLGTIAHSGTQAFLKQAAQQENKDVALIGQFGVGFYSAFLVADKVAVTSRAAGADEAWTWTSEAQDSFTLEPAERAEVGTTVLLHLKEEQDKYSQEWQLEHLVKRYSDFVAHPIQMEKEGAPPEEELAEGEVVEKTWTTINEANALWQRAKADVTQEQYDEFYEHLSQDHQGVAGHTHFRIEGMQQFTGLLYLPQKAPFDLFMRDFRRGVRLYVKRVFIMDDAEDLVPQWLRFVRGVIDSDDLPLNVSRELLQDSAITRTISKQIIKKTLDLLEDMAANRTEVYDAFWEEFGAVVKEGLHFDPKYASRLAKLVRFESSKADGLTGLEAYVEGMPEGQSDIYYIIGESKAQVEGSPHLEALKKRGWEVLYMTDTVDEWAVQGLREFDGKTLVSALKADLDLDGEDSEEDKKKKEEMQEGLKGLTAAMQTTLDAHVKEVRMSSRLTDSPACLVTPEGGMNAHLERLLRMHEAEVPENKRILEINPDHVLIGRMQALFDKEGASDKLTDWVWVLYDQSLMVEGSPVADPQAFAKRVTRLLEQAAFGAVMG